jgi:hypothetical protein
MTILIESITELDKNILDGNVAGKNYTNYFLLHGLIQHNVYHAGQIALLKKTLN